MIRFAKMLRLPHFRHLYVMYCPDRAYVGKVGISTSGEDRRSGVEQSIRERYGEHINVWQPIKLPVLFSAWHEKKIHAFYRAFGANYGKFSGTSGHTEWFYSGSIIFAFLVYTLCKYMGYAAPVNIFCAALCCLCPLPLDMVLIVAAFAFVEWALIIFGIFSAFCWVL